ncbi:MAG: HigA family addiction module antitoxin [Patescibacteria group bacterium]|nr:HigA family addiction module antitoxin [Patescibacteria group bacterium]
MSYKPSIALHPGKTLALTIERASMSQIDLSQRTGISEKHISHIMNGKTVITLDTALKLERVLGGNADFWINLENQYQENKARLKQEEQLKKEIIIMKEYPYLELSKTGAVKKTIDNKEKVDNLLNFFAVDSLSFVLKTEAIAFKKTNTDKISKESLAAWLRFGEIEAKKQEVNKFDKNKLKKKIDELKKLTHLPNNFSEQIRKICAECGVKVLFTPYLKNTYVNGAVRWVGDNPVIQLTIRYKYSDIFWFTFLHEVGHILLHGKTDQFIDFNEKIKRSSKKEKEADKFASNTLIDYNEYKNFVSQNDFKNIQIKTFAKKLDVDPGIVAGRLAHDKLVDWSSVCYLRKKLEIKR